MSPYVQGSPEATSYQISKDMADEYLGKLKNEGPDPGHKRNDPFQWFPLHDDTERMSDIVKGEYAGRTTSFCRTQLNDTMLNTPGADRWTLADSYPTQDEMGKPAVGFKFDVKGASIFGKLTSLHKKPEGGRQGDIMAVLLDDEVYSAPNIQSTITDSGIISGSFTTQEVQDLVSTFKAARCRPGKPRSRVGQHVPVGPGRDQQEAEHQGRRNCAGGGGGLHVAVLFPVRPDRRPGAGAEHRDDPGRDGHLRRGVHHARHRRIDPDHRHGRGLQRADQRAPAGRAGPGAAIPARRSRTPTTAPSLRSSTRT